MSDLEELETELRRMLKRRAADIDDAVGPTTVRPTATHAADSGSGAGGAPAPASIEPETEFITVNQTDLRPRPGFGRRPLVATAAVLVLLVVAVTAIGRATVDRIETAVSGEDQEGDETETGDRPQPTTTIVATTEAPLPPVWTPQSALSAALELLPPDFDPVNSSPVLIDYSSPDPEQIAANYLTTRIPQGSTSALIGSVGDLLMYRWSAGESGGFLILRTGARLPEVVAATTDGVTVATTERTINELSVTVDMGPAIAADALFLNPQAEALGPSQPVGGDGGTISTDAGPVPITVRVDGQEPAVLVEFAVEAVGFAAECGAEPPIAIEVGEMTDPRREGPIITDTPVLVNQRVWHHVGSLADLEIRWPADPGNLARIDATSLETSMIVGGNPFAEPDDQTPTRRLHTLLRVGPVEQAPCDVVQITVDGDSQLAGWWASALSSEWSFGFALSIADLDPDDPANGLVDQPPEGPVSLVVESVEMAGLPVIPATGSCDGLPDAPPQTGPGLADSHPDPEAALAAFVDRGPHGDPPLADSGYTGVIVGGGIAGYAVLDGETAYTVVEMLEGADGWTITGWTASAC